MSENGTNPLVNVFDPEKATWILNESDGRFEQFRTSPNGLFHPALIESEVIEHLDSDKAMIESAVQTILAHVGENPNREGLQRTPHRVAKMYDELLAGYKVDPAALVNGALFDVEYDEMIAVKDIEFFSMCEHHMLRSPSTAVPTSPTSPAKKSSASPKSRAS